MNRIEKNIYLLALLMSFILTGSNPVFAHSSSKDKKKPLITSFHFEKLYGGVIIVKATIDNFKDSLNFILDTGSGGISLDSTSCAELGITTIPSGRTIRGIAGVKQVNFAYNHSLHLPGLKIDSMDFHINDYEMLSGVYGLRIDGIIGYSFFKRFVVSINFDDETIRIYPAGAFSYPGGGHLLHPAIASLPMQYAEVIDNTTLKARYYIDTGAGLCLLLSQQYVNDSSLFVPDKPMFASVAEGLGGKKEMSITVVERFKIGKFVFKQMPAYVFNDEFNVTSYPFLAGLIGNDLLRRFNLTINYGKGEFHLKPNNSFREQFDYSYTGFNMYQQELEVIVIDVMPGSPAERAGLENGDVIISIGNKLAGTLQEYKIAIQNAGFRTKMVILRKGKLEELKLEIENITKKKPEKRIKKS